MTSPADMESCREQSHRRTQHHKSSHMYQIHAHAIPIEGSDQYGQVAGAYVVAYINYADPEGALELVRYYVKESGWELTDIEEEYSLIDSEDAIDAEQAEFYQEALKNGYSLVFYSYESEKED